MTELRPINSLRGFAALLILILHSFWPYLGTGGPLILGRLYLGVDLFFFISGFILAHVYADSFTRGVSFGAVCSFLWARIARIYPLHLFAILPYLVYYGQSEHLSGQNLILNLLLMQSWIPYWTWYTFSWSIGAEWHAYLLFPFAAYILSRCGVTVKAALSIGLLAALCYVNSDIAERTLGHGLAIIFRVLPEFLIGMLTYEIYASKFLVTVWRRNETILIVLLISAASPQFSSSDFYAVAMMPLLILCSVANDGVISKILNWSIFNKLGHISYSIYMVQGISLTMCVTLAESPVFQLIGPYGIILVFFIVDIGLGALAYRYVEVPARNLLRQGRRRGAHRRPATAALPIPGPEASRPLNP